MSTLTKEMLEEAISLITTPDSAKKAFFEKYLPDIKDIENYSVILPESFRGFESFEWVYIDRYLEEGKAYAVNTKATLAPSFVPPLKIVSNGVSGIELPSKVV